MKKIFEQNNNKITFISLLLETIMNIFVSSISPSEERQNYNTKEKWTIWFKDTFNLEKFKNICKRLLKGFTYFIIIFSIINIFTFTPIVLRELKSQRYPVARAYLKSAFMVDQLYIIPLSKIFGYGNPLTWGFYPIKDFLYNQGMSKLPKNEGEREIWWFNIRFVEFKTVVQPTLSDSYTYNDKTYKPLPKWQVKSFEKWNDELYSHILSWSDAKISDPRLKKEKLIRFVDLAEAYESSTYVLSVKKQVQGHNRVDFNPSHLPGPKPEAVKNYMNVVNIFNNLKFNSAKNEKESYDYFEQNKRYYEDKFLYETALDLIRSKRDWGPIVTCSSPEVNILATSHKNLREFYIKNYSSLKPGEKGTIQILVTGPIKLPVCNNQSITIEYAKFRQKYGSRFSRPYETFLELIK